MLAQFAALAALAFSLGTASTHPRKTCTIEAGGSNVTDDAPAIIKAFKCCGHNGRVVFKPTTYYINSAMNITWLDDVEVDLKGTLLVRPHRLL